MSSQNHEIPHMELITFHDSSRGRFLLVSLNKQQSVQSCFAGDHDKKIFINGIFLIEGEKGKVEKVLEIFPSCSDNLELHFIRHSQNNCAEKNVFLNSEVFSTCSIVMCVYGGVVI